ncbi:hypothetical protein PoB_000153300 [Plakobranchus ocellatus]|uniref:Uncharacterized protein n=1 Tax=Plakobranchus ocellatus TaxID=259542 RepID=A0AAV3XXP1_9GAST|nr:hypothetical protein PoB_000153300 [Plakobranchus ocellatus]
MCYFAKDNGSDLFIVIGSRKSASVFYSSSTHSRRISRFFVFIFLLSHVGVTEAIGDVHGYRHFADVPQGLFDYDYNDFKFEGIVTSVAQWLASPPRDPQGPSCRGFEPRHQRPDVTEGLKA